MSSGVDQLLARTEKEIELNQYAKPTNNTPRERSGQATLFWRVAVRTCSPLYFAQQEFSYTKCTHIIRNSLCFTSRLRWGFVVLLSISFFGASPETRYLTLQHPPTLSYHIIPCHRYGARETFQGRWSAEGDAAAVLVMVWDNSYSRLRPKTLAYKVGIYIYIIIPGIYIIYQAYIYLLYYFFPCHPTMCSMIFNIDHS